MTDIASTASIVSAPSSKSTSHHRTDAHHGASAAQAPQTTWASPARVGLEPSTHRSPGRVLASDTPDIVPGPASDRNAVTATTLSHRPHGSARADMDQAGSASQRSHDRYSHSQATSSGQHESTTRGGAGIQKPETQDDAQSRADSSHRRHASTHNVESRSRQDDRSWDVYQERKQTTRQAIVQALREDLVRMFDETAYHSNPTTADTTRSPTRLSPTKHSSASHRPHGATSGYFTATDGTNSFPSSLNSSPEAVRARDYRYSPHRSQHTSDSAVVHSDEQPAMQARSPLPRAPKLTQSARESYQAAPVSSAYVQCTPDRNTLRARQNRETLQWRAARSPPALGSGDTPISTDQPGWT